MTTGNSICPGCNAPVPRHVLDEAAWYPFWFKPDGACPACVQQNLLRTLLREGDEALHRAVQSEWPLDAEAAFGALPTPLRLHADPRFAARRVTMAFVDSAFHPHPDLVKPRNRIRVWVDASGSAPLCRRFAPDVTPTWPGSAAGAPHQWHGTMTSVVGAGNGFLSHGLYRGLASEADVVLLATRDPSGAITSASILRALEWIERHHRDLGIRIVSLSVSGDPSAEPASDPVDAAVARLFEAGILVVAAAGNDGVRHLLPPATAPLALTVGGIDDQNVLDHRLREIWHSNFGSTAHGAPKPEIVAPSIWVAAPVLPGTGIAREAQQLFAAGGRGNGATAARIAELKLITPHYQHVDGTSFAAPLVASAAACLLEANPRLSSRQLRDALLSTAEPLEGVDRHRQGHGVVAPGRAISAAQRERSHRHRLAHPSPQILRQGVRFALHDHAAASVRVHGSWDGWRNGLAAKAVEPGLWQTEVTALPSGRHVYKFLIDERRWVHDPENPEKSPDGHGDLNAVLDLTS
jgi:serine protease AprX